MDVILSKQAEKHLEKVPSFILRKFDFWVKSIMGIGLERTREYKGFRDKMLKGKRKGQYSIRLNRSYRAFYKVKDHGTVYVLGVTKHEY